ncbi:MAG: TspO/MBR family protein [Planctomycetota bacterium]
MSPITNEMQPSSTPQSRSWPALVGFVLLCVVGGAASGLVTPPDGWYWRLAKPSWTPPPWLFGPVWTLLYLMMGVSAWMLWRRRAMPGGRLATGLFFAQLALNFAWTPLFFGLHALGVAFAEIVMLWLLIAATIATGWRAHRVAAALMLPYLAWVTFASALNFAIWRLN